jgi:branched-subunit amino acid transport protein
MTAVWTVVVLTGAATVALKAAGPVLLGARRLPRAVGAVVALLAPALLAALIVVQTFSAGQQVVLDARAAGLAVAAIALALRAPTLLVVVLAAATAAAVRQLTGA